MTARKSVLLSAAPGRGNSAKSLGGIKKMIPRDFFPHMPDEVFDTWLAPLAEDYGWPFKKSQDCIKETKWFVIFGNYDLEFWTSVKWRIISTQLHPEIFANGTCFRLNSIIQFCTEGVPTFTANLQGTVERFRACTDFIRANRKLPRPIVAITRNRIEFEIIDGHHRIAALLHVGIPVGYEIPIWIPIISKD